MKFGLVKLTGSLIAAALIASTSYAEVLISDSYETDSSANYTVVNDGTPDGTVDFSFDYVAAGLPLAPRSAPGGGRGLRFTANDTAGAVDAFTAFHNTATTATNPNYRLTVDVFMGWAGAVGTTEYAQVGVGGNGTTFNSVFTPISGSGAFLAFTGDGGSASDYRWYRSTANTPAGDTFSTTLPNTHSSYLGRGSNNTGTFFQSLFPLSSGATVAGSPGNIWTTVDIEVNNGTIAFSFNGTETFRGLYSGNLNGLVSLGINDPNAASIDPGNVFTLYDNLTVTAVPEPSTVMLLGLAAIGGVSVKLRRRKAQAE